MFMWSFATVLVLETMTTWAIFLSEVNPAQKFLSGPFMVPDQQPIAPNIPSGYKEACESEAKNWVKNVSTDPFYKSPTDWEYYTAGSILRIEKANISEYTVIPKTMNVSLYRLLYQSLDHNNKLVPASAFILFPYSRTYPTAPLRVIVWAHGTSGIERQCPPSNQRDLYYNWDGPLAMVLHDYVVIAPDYAGLGSDTTFHYVASPNHASDIAHAVIAARAAFPSGIISHEWVIVGHSEGGLAAWAANEREFAKPIGGLLGTVSLSPVSMQLQNLRYCMEHHDGFLHGNLRYFSYCLIAMARMIESINSTNFFSDLGIERARLAATACYDTAEVLYTNLTFSDIFKDSSWLYSSWGTNWENKMGITGRKPLAAPLLIIQGLADTAIYPATTYEVFRKQCNFHSNTRAHLSLYPGLDHDAITYSSQHEIFDWIEARFNDVEVLPGCTSSTSSIIDTIISL